MRTKTLLVAAAALAAAITSSQAQTVYSQNIVGYVNQVLPGNPAYSLVTAPLTGTTNAADQIITCLQPGDTISLWNGTTFVVYTYFPGIYTGTNFVDGSFNALPTPTLAPGQAFFYQNEQGSNETNTWTGSCAVGGASDIHSFARAVSPAWRVVLCAYRPICFDPTAVSAAVRRPMKTRSSCASALRA